MPKITIIALEFTKSEIVLTLLNVYTPEYMKLLECFGLLTFLVALKLFKILNFGYWEVRVMLYIIFLFYINVGIAVSTKH